MSKKAVDALWEASEPYQNEGKEGRMVCDIQIVDGQLVSEDNVVMRKLAELGFDVWLDPRMTCCHIGTKKFYGDFEDFVSRLKLAEAA
jgi:hypothetical protein